MPAEPDHPHLTPQCRCALTRHKHDYGPPPDTGHRCTCGHTKFKITVGGALPAVVTCAKCGNRNPRASAYERGYEVGYAAALANTGMAV